ncbi:hypothetical protein AB2T90_17210 [Clostridium butyricum]|uniref:hypothetical protein n=1 Tax=Clostridium butyricum TaxID=1492 RepID=UPI00346557CB
MQLLTRLGLKEKVRTLSISVKTMGDLTLTDEEEIAIIEDYSPVYVELKDLTFSGKYKIDSDNNVIKDDSAGEEVTIKIQNRKLLINKDLRYDFSLSIEDVKESELSTIFNTKNKLNEAKVILVKDTVEKAIIDKIKEIKALKNNFEQEIESDIF